MWRQSKVTVHKKGGDAVGVQVKSKLSPYPLFRRNCLTRRVLLCRCSQRSARGKLRMAHDHHADRPQVGRIAAVISYSRAHSGLDSMSFNAPRDGGWAMSRSQRLVIA